MKDQSSETFRKAVLDTMNVPVSLTLEASEIFLSLHMLFSLERADVIWAILEREFPKTVKSFRMTPRRTTTRYKIVMTHNQNVFQREVKIKCQRLGAVLKLISRWKDKIRDTEVLKRTEMQNTHTLLKLAQVRWLAMS